MKYDAVIFDLFGTLVYSFTVEEYKSILSSMALELGIPEESFMESWFSSFNMRVLGEFKTVEQNIIHVCDELNIP